MNNPEDKSGNEDGVCLRVRIATRLAWMDVTQADFASAIGVDKSSLSRAMRANCPRLQTLQRIALGLGLDLSDLSEHADPRALVTAHPAIDASTPRGKRALALKSWYDKMSQKLIFRRSFRKTDASRSARREEVREALAKGEFDVGFVRDLADRYDVSMSQVYADKTYVLKATKPAVEG